MPALTHACCIILVLVKVFSCIVLSSRHVRILHFRCGLFFPLLCRRSRNLRKHWRMQSPRITVILAIDWTGSRNSVRGLPGADRARSCAYGGRAALRRSVWMSGRQTRRRYSPMRVKKRLLEPLCTDDTVRHHQQTLLFVFPGELLRPVAVCQ